jgi:hypothetical protein
MRLVLESEVDCFNESLEGLRESHAGVHDKPVITARRAAALVELQCPTCGTREARAMRGMPWAG